MYIEFPLSRVRFCFLCRQTGGDSMISSKVRFSSVEFVFFSTMLQRGRSRSTRCITVHDGLIVLRTPVDRTFCFFIFRHKWPLFRSWNYEFPPTTLHHYTQEKKTRAAKRNEHLLPIRASGLWGLRLIVIFFQDKTMLVVIFVGSYSKMVRSKTWERR